jgi:hypothetical protein
MCAAFILIFNIKITASEMQLFGGFEFGFGSYEVKNDFWFTNNVYGYFCTEDTTSVFFAPGITLGVRVFFDGNPFGFIFRDRALFITNLKQAGKVSINNVYTSISETYSVADDDFFIGLMDFSSGLSFRHIISNRFQFYADCGLNFSVMESEDYDSGDTLEYLGLGIFSTLALQTNITQIMYFEFGINSIINILSNQEGEYKNPFYPSQLKKYEDTGRFDLISVAAYLTLGWRLNLEELRSRTWN